MLVSLQRVIAKYEDGAPDLVHLPALLRYDRRVVPDLDSPLIFQAVLLACLSARSKTRCPKLKKASTTSVSFLKEVNPVFSMP